MLERFKTVLIIVLIMITFYQLFEVWNETPILEVIAESFKAAPTISDEYYLKPSNIMISSGDKKFVSIKNNTSQSELIEKYIEEIYGQIFGNKINPEVTDEKIEEIMNYRSIILCYDEDYDFNVFEELFNIENDKVLKNISKMVKVIICPNTSEISRTQVYVEGDEGKILKFELNIDTTELYGLIDEINMFDQMNIFLLSENYNFKRYFNNQVFLPAIINDKTIFETTYKVSNPFEDVETLEEKNALIEAYANIFFENPKAKWKMEKDANVVIFGDGEKSIRVYRDGFAQYTNSVMLDEECTLQTAVTKASQIIAKDLYIAKEAKLVNITKTSSNSYELSYDYFVNGLDIVLSDEIKDKYKISYPLTVNVSGGEVVGYKSIILKSTIVENENDIQIGAEVVSDDSLVTYDTVLDSVYQNDNSVKINDMEVAYYKRDMDTDAEILWIVITDDNTITHEAIVK